MKRSPSSSGEPGKPPQMWSPWSKKISEHGPQGPVSPIAQKLSDAYFSPLLSPIRIIRSGAKPISLFQMS